jgi:hypothetical protein
VRGVIKRLFLALEKNSEIKFYFFFIEQIVIISRIPCLLIFSWRSARALFCNWRAFVH